MPTSPTYSANPVLALEIDRTGAADHTDNFVALLEQKFGQVAAVLASDAGDQGAFCPCHRGVFSFPVRRPRRYGEQGLIRCGPFLWMLSCLRGYVSAVSL